MEENLKDKMRIPPNLLHSVQVRSDWIHIFTAEQDAEHRNLHGGRENMGGIPWLPEQIIIIA